MMFGHLFSSEAGNTDECSALPIACHHNSVFLSPEENTFLTLPTLSALSDISFLASYDSRKTYLLFGRNINVLKDLGLPKKLSKCTTIEAMKPKDK